MREASLLLRRAAGLTASALMTEPDAPLGACAVYGCAMFLFHWPNPYPLFAASPSPRKNNADAPDPQ